VRGRRAGREEEVREGGSSALHLVALAFSKCPKFQIRGVVKAHLRCLNMELSPVTSARLIMHVDARRNKCILFRAQIRLWKNESPCRASRGLSPDHVSIFFAHLNSADEVLTCFETKSTNFFVFRV
jgi:hypothetical protein